MDIKCIPFFQAHASPFPYFYRWKEGTCEFGPPADTEGMGSGEEEVMLRGINKQDFKKKLLWEMMGEMTF